MFCPHCHNKIPDGSNICPLCYANLAGVKPQAPAAPKDAERQDAPARTSARFKMKPASGWPFSVTDRTYMFARDRLSARIVKTFPFGRRNTACGSCGAPRTYSPEAGSTG